jgi:hypothetical protein
MPFEPITHIKLNKTTGAPIGKAWIKKYVKLLDELSTGGVDTKAKLVSDAQEVITLIEILESDTNDTDKTTEEKQKTQDKAREQRRQYYSAIFYALDEYPLDDKKLYYDAFQKAKQNAPSSF